MPSLSSAAMRPRQKVGHRCTIVSNEFLWTKMSSNGHFSESRVKVAENESTGYIVLNVVYSTELQIYFIMSCKTVLYSRAR
jgi:hypothetical protein